MLICERDYVYEDSVMGKMKEYICLVDPAGWYATKPVTELVRCGKCRRKRYCPMYAETEDEDGYCFMAERKETE